MMRVILDAGHQSTLSASTYLRAAGAVDYGTDMGTPMMRSGSIVAVTATATISGHSGNGTLTIEVRKNHLGAGGVLVFSATSPTITGNGTISWSASQDPGVDTFIADEDKIQLRMVKDSGTYSFIPIATCELEINEP